jgi:hypothetical protein
MVAVPHACFSATFPEDGEFSHPPGAFLVRKLDACLCEVADVVDPFDNWRDCGWVVRVSMRGHRFEIYFAPFNGSRWLLAVAPIGQPGILAKLLGRKSVDVSAELRGLSDSVHQLLSGLPFVSKLFWQFGGPPNASLGVPSPDRLSWASAP